MLYALTPGQMKAADASAINELGIPSIVLMENAARSAADHITEILRLSSKKISDILIICGSGNNGGDGFAIARHLFEKFPVRIARTGEHLKMSPETYVNYQAAEKLGISIVHIKEAVQIDESLFESDCVIDAMIGVGGSEEIKGITLEILKAIKKIESLKIAIDVPTGLNSETGTANQYCFEADFTVTMFAIKTGMLLNEGVEKCGKILQAYLGAPVSVVQKKSFIRILEKEDIISIIPNRKRISSKFDYGRVLIIAGSQSFPGAAALCANAAVSSGAGLVQLISTSIHPSVMPDVISNVVHSTQTGTISPDTYDFIRESALKADSVLIGPGLGNDPDTIEMIKRLIIELPASITLVIDADGLRAIQPGDILRKNIILTPHSGEFSHLTGINRDTISLNHANLAMEWAAKFGCIIHLKHVPAVTTDGNISYWSVNGNPAMAKGGSGDVLSGIISSLAARGIEPLEATAAGAWLHAAAGDLYIEKYSHETLTAASLTGLLKEVYPK